MSRIRDAEANVLGGIAMVGEAAYWKTADLLTADDFSTPLNRAMWQVMTDLARGGIPIDFSTIADRNPALEADALAMANATPSAVNIRAYAEIVARDATARRVRKAGEQIAKLGGEDALGEAQRLIGSCVPRMASQIKHAREFLKESVALMAARCEQIGDLTGVPTSVAWLDAMTAGWQRSNLIIIGARPSVGKTAFALQAAIHAAKAGHAVLFLSLEMSGAELTDRAIAHLSGIDGKLIRQPKGIAEEDWPRITDAGAEIDGMPLLIDETAGLTIEAVEARIRQANAMQRLGLVVIDYLTQITPPKAEKLTDAIQIITRRLKALAKEIKVPIILLSQLNRAGDHKPTLTSLRESGAIEQDADVVILLHRPCEDKPHLLEMMLAKQRNGPKGDCYLHAHDACARFRATEERPPEAVVQQIPRRRGFNAPRFIERSAGE